MQQAAVEDELLLCDNICCATLIYLTRHRSCFTAVNVYEISSYSSIEFCSGVASLSSLLPHAVPFRTSVTLGTTRLEAVWNTFRSF